MESRIERLCIERGLKMTGQRRVVARVLSEAGDHPDVEELYRRASALDQHISIATVYRTVRLFEEQGILERRDFGGGRARYEPTEDGPHYHLIDVETGKVIEFQDPDHERLMHDDRRTPWLRCGVPAPGTVWTAPRDCTPPLPRPDPEIGDTVQGSGMMTEELAGFPAVRRTGPFAEIRSGDLGVRIAAGSAEIDAVQALRYRVFYQELGARADAATSAARRDRDIYDTVADHLLVVDHSLGEGRRRRRGHLSADPARSCATDRAFLLLGRIRHRADRSDTGSYPGTGPILRRRRLSQPSGHATAVARYRGLCVSEQDRTDVWLCQPAGHRTRRVGDRIDVSVL